MSTDTLCKMGFVEQFVALLQREHDSTHEHLLSALLALTEGHQAAIVECKRSEFQLKELLNKRLELITGQEEFQVKNILHGPVTRSSRRVSKSSDIKNLFEIYVCITGRS